MTTAGVSKSVDIGIDHSLGLERPVLDFPV